MGSCRARSVYLTTRYWAGLVLKAVKHYCAHSFARNWQLPFLNQRKGENDRRIYFMINLHERMLPTSTGLNPRPPGLQSDGASNWATEAGFQNWFASLLKKDLYPLPCWINKMPYPFLIFNRSDTWSDPGCWFKVTYSMANSADPYQLDSSEANWSGFTLFAKTGQVRDRVKQSDKSEELVPLHEENGVQEKQTWSHKKQWTPQKLSSLVKYCGCLQRAFFMFCLFSCLIVVFSRSSSRKHTYIILSP